MSGDRDKCIRFLEKSLRMYDDSHTQSLLQKVAMYINMRVVMGTSHWEVVGTGGYGYS